MSTGRGALWRRRRGYYGPDYLDLEVGARRVVIRNTADTVAYRFTPMIGSPDQTRLRLCFTTAGGTGEECFDS
ncbi:hypothetical protein [Streptomyces sp. NPDC056323]|uniref:hypothetical protein n=1 Tax=Streptomyces sp. NPDC056323 TaxID=3345784 RepID=UPI0035DFBFB7